MTVAAEPRNIGGVPHPTTRSVQCAGHVGFSAPGVVGTWLHGEFLTLDDAKMAKSAGNIIRVADLPSKGFEPLAFRYLALTAHYRSKLDFTDAAMHAAASGLGKLRRATTGIADPVDLGSEPMASYRAGFRDAVADDLATPRALALAHEVACSSDLTHAQRRALLLDFDRVLGLSLDAPDPESALPEGAADLLDRRAAAQRRSGLRGVGCPSRRTGRARVGADGQRNRATID